MTDTNEIVSEARGVARISSREGGEQAFGGPKYPLPKTESSSDLAPYFGEGPKFIKIKQKQKEKFAGA